MKKAGLTDFTVIDRDSNTLHWQIKEALHISIKDPSLKRNTCKVRIPSVFNKFLKPHTQLEQWLSSIFHPRVAPSSLGPSTKKTTLHAFLISIYNRSVIPMFTPFKLQNNWIFRSPTSKKYIWKQFAHITKCNLLQKYLSFRFSGLLISSSAKAKEVSKKQFLVNAAWIIYNCLY